MLIMSSAQHVLAEGEDFQFNIQTTSGFPPMPASYQWLYNDVNIPMDSLNPIVSNFPNITFSNVSRHFSGNYSVSAINNAGTASGWIILDVQCKYVMYVFQLCQYNNELLFFFLLLDGAEGTVQSGPVYVLVNDTVTITGFSQIDGNPVPTSSWSFDGLVLDDGGGGGRYDTTDLGQLTISSVALSDAGNYTNTLVNTVTESNTTVRNTLELVVVGTYVTQSPLIIIN